MESIKIRFGNADEVWKFVNTIRRFNGEYDLAAGSYTVDANPFWASVRWEREKRWI